MNTRMENQIERKSYIQTFLLSDWNTDGNQLAPKPVY